MVGVQLAGLGVEQPLDIGDNVRVSMPAFTQNFGELRLHPMNLRIGDNELSKGQANQLRLGNERFQVAFNHLAAI